MQSKLIKGGFTSFRSDFTASEIEKYRTEGIEKAVASARSKAEVMAKAANRQIKRVVKVADTEDNDPGFRNFRQSDGPLNEIVVRGQSVMANLMEFPQTIAVQAQVKVVFELR